MQPHPIRPKRRARDFRILMLAAATAASLVACGSDDPPPAASAPEPVRGDLLAEASVARLAVAELDAIAAAAGLADVAGPARCDVEVRSISHRTVGVDGEPATASAALLVPGGAACPGPYPMLAYARGTDGERSRTLADPADRETRALMGIFAARGYAVVATDYLGYAQSDYPFHPYLDPDTEAAAVIDSIRAARTVLGTLGVAITDRLFLAGYSQGGHATMAAQRQIERERPPGIAVTAAGPMAGPYDLRASLEGEVLLLPRLLQAVAPPLGVPAVLRFGDRFLTAGLDNLLQDRAWLERALERSSVLDWTPEAPMLLCHGSRDPVVPFANAVRAVEAFGARGVQVALVDVETVPEFSTALPPPGAPVSELSTYHSRIVPPLCFRTVRDLLFEPLR